MGELSASSYISVRLKQEFDPMILFSLHINGVKMYSLLNDEYNHCYNFYLFYFKNCYENEC